MGRLTELRCFNHSDREAAARCTMCGRSFCRECITEHEGRVHCAACLPSLARGGSKKRSAFPGILGGAWCAVSFVFTWFLFYYLGKLLAKLPSNFHKTIFQGF